MSEISNTLARELLDKVKLTFTEETLTTANIMRFVNICMETVETYRNLPGLEKKALVIKTVKLAVADLVPDTKEFALLESFAEFFIDQLIDEIVEVNDGKLHINIKKSKLYAIFSTFKCCFGKK